MMTCFESAVLRQQLSMWMMRMCKESASWQESEALMLQEKLAPHAESSQVMEA